jgi:hypothetical protein
VLVFFFFFGSAAGGIQGLACAGQVLYC